MKKIIVLFVVLVMLLASFTSAFARWSQVTIEIVNKSYRDVTINLSGDPYFYFLTVPAFETRTFAVERGVYEHQTFACNRSAEGTLDATTKLKLVFINCGSAHDQGEPTQEKISIPETPTGIKWHYQMK